MRVTGYPIRPGWLALVEEDVLDPARPIVDAPHHLWNRPTIRYLLPDLLEDMASGHNIVATVYLEASEAYREAGPEHLRSVGETQFATTIADAGGSARAQVCAAIVSHVDLAQPPHIVEEALSAHRAAGGARFKGVRGHAAWDPSGLGFGSRPQVRGLLLSAEFRAGFARLARHGLSYDAWQYHTQLGELTDLARAFPETTIIVNHLGAPLGAGPYAGRRDEVFRDWRQGIRGLAACPNVSMKLGGMGTTLAALGFDGRQLPPTSDEIASAMTPYVDTCIEAFGAGRCMFESNFPPDKQSFSYPVLWNAYKKLARHASEVEKDALFSGTAARVYRLAA
ncbi:MAG: amidohydrolase family protein [Rhizobiaceae bacterium]|nr:amidohydrolase family protein [Rhizobiaceae bacterium]